MKAIQDEADAKRKALIDSVSTQIKPMLTPDQQTKLSALVERIESHGGPGPGAGPGGEGGFRRRFGNGGAGAPAPAPSASNNNSAPAGPGAGGTGNGGPGGPGGQSEVLQRLTNQLGLTPDQQDKIKPILESAHTQVQSIRMDNSMTEDQRLAKIRSTMDAIHGPGRGNPDPCAAGKICGDEGQFPPQGRGPSRWPSFAGSTRSLARGQRDDGLHGSLTYEVTSSPIGPAGRSRPMGLLGDSEPGLTPEECPQPAWVRRGDAHRGCDRTRRSSGGCHHQTSSI